MEDLHALGAVPLFAALSPQELSSLFALMERNRFAAGDHILREGDAGHCLHVVVAGSVKITTADQSGDDVLLAEAGVGSFFGELSLLTDEPRSASVRSVEATTTLSLERSQLLSFLETSPHASRTMMAVLAQRLTQTTLLVRSGLRSVNDLDDERLTVGDRVADRFAATMGSWRFISIQSALLVAYIAWNVLSRFGHWDPYPFLLMSLLLSFQAAYAAPIIMMSQNRQAAKDRLTAANNHEVNVKASVEIGRLHTRLDEIELILAGAPLRTGVQPSATNGLLGAVNPAPNILDSSRK